MFNAGGGLLLSMEKKGNLLLLSPVQFWRKDAGNCLIINKSIEDFPCEKIFLAYPFKRKKELKEELLKEYHFADIIALPSLKVFFTRAIRSLLYHLHLPIPYFLLRPFRFTSHRKNKFYSYCKKNRIDFIECEYIWFADRMKKARKDPEITTSIDTHDIQNRFCSSLRKNFGRTKNDVSEFEEISILNNADAVTAVSKDDTLYFKQRLSTNVFYLPPLCVSSDYSQLKKTKSENGLRIGFVAGYSDFNLSAATWFIQNVFNSLCKEFSVTFHVFGSVSKGLEEYAKQNASIVLHGFVKEAKDIYRNIDVSVNPTTQEGGIKVKNLESLYFSTPVLTSDKGSRGFEGADKLQARYICKDKQDYIEVLSELCQNSLLVKSSSKGAYDFVSKNFSEEIYESYYKALKRIHSKD